MNFMMNLMPIVGSSENTSFEGSWNGVYDFIEFTLETFPFSEARPSQNFQEHCNMYLKREMSAYRVIDLQVVRLTDNEELEAVAQPIKFTDKYAPLATPIKTALKHLSDRKAPDYRNSV